MASIIRALIIIVLLAVSIQVQAATFKIYMNPNGNDSFSGTSQAQAVKTLGRVQAILQAVDPAGPVEVHIVPGTYYGQSVNWTYTNGQTITFTSLDFGTTRPVFDGQGTSGTWFNFRSGKGEESKLHFRYIGVQRYITGISFTGDRENELTGWNGGNRLYGMHFAHIGGAWSQASSYSTAAVHFVNSRNNQVINSHFVNIENTPELAGAIHALYLAHYASGNIIERNKFTRINGDPIKVRDSSNGNYVTNNTFYRTGGLAYYQDWFCDSSRSDCTKLTPECPSFNNVFSDNTLQRGYNGAVIPATTVLGPIDDCPRLSAFGNVQS